LREDSSHSSSNRPLFPYEVTFLPSTIITAA
jgi:hypothetical protein